MASDELLTWIPLAEGAPRVLMVDDDALLRLLARTALEGIGFAIDEAENGVEAVAAVADSPPDLVVLDLDMPIMDGFEACCRMRASPSGRHIPILVLTGRDDTESVKRAFELGATDFAVKPINWLVLAHRLEYMLRASRAAERLRRSENRLANAQRIARLGYWEWEVSTELMSLSHPMREILGLRSVAGPIRVEEFLGRIHAEDRPRVRAALQELVRSRQENETAFRILRSDRRERLVLQRAELQIGTGGEPVRVLGAVQDVTERRSPGREIWEPTTHDDLTGLPNRRSCLRHLETALASANRLAAMRRMQIADDLGEACERGQLLLHYQPRFELSSGLIVGAEALLRWQHPETGMLAPARFMPLAEETGLIVPIGEWVLASACRQAVSWHRAGLARLRIAVNVSTRQLTGGSFALTVARILADTGIDPQLLDLELTESSLRTDGPDTSRHLEALKSLGPRLCLDDFGTGVCSLSDLTRSPLDVLKVDRAFVRGVPDRRGNVAVARTILAMARSLGLEVVAEGIETFDELRFLRQEGCEFAQGFHFSRPLPDSGFARLLRSSASSSPPSLATLAR